MIPSLPPSLGSLSRPTSARHAQDLSVTRLKQHAERAGARVSMNQVRHHRSGPKATTSMHRQLTSSLRDDGADGHGGYSEEEREEIRTRLRYRHIRKMIQERKDAEKEAQKKDVS